MAADRLALAHAFEAAGFARDASETVASAVLDAIHDNVASKADIAGLHSNLVGLRSDLKAEIAVVRADLKTDIAAVRAELKTDNASLRTELKTDIAGVRSDLALVQHQLFTRL